MLTQGIIDPSSSKWALPVVLIKKKDGSLRLCIDYRKVNAVSTSYVYPIPCIDDLIDELGQAKFITTLDLHVTHGYWQVPVAEEHCQKTAFITPYGLYQFRNMPFGLKGAPATFQRMMNNLLMGLEGHTSAYIDDLVIYSRSWEEHMKRLRQVFSRLKEAGLTVKRICDGQLCVLGGKRGGEARTEKN